MAEADKISVEAINEVMRLVDAYSIETAIAITKRGREHDVAARQRMCSWLNSLPNLARDAPYWTNGCFAQDCRDAAEWLLPELPVPTGGRSQD